jgi:hypothetical protein
MVPSFNTDRPGWNLRLRRERGAEIEREEREEIEERRE